MTALMSQELFQYSLSIEQLYYFSLKETNSQIKTELQKNPYKIIFGWNFPFKC